MKPSTYSTPVKSILLILVLIGLSSVARAQDEEADQYSTVEYTFGKELRFILSAKEADEIKAITLSFRPELSSDLYVVNVPFEPGESLSVTFPVDVTMIDLMPYSAVNYSWELETDSGPRIIPERSFDYEDDRFTWTKMTREGVTAHWTGGGPAFGDDILDVVDNTLAQLKTVLPLETIRPLDVYVYPSSADFRSGVELVGLDSEETVYSDRDVIFVTAVNPQSAVSDLGQSIPFKLTHLLMYQIAGDNYSTFPWWLTEGLGTIFQSRPNARSAQIMDEAVQADAAIPLLQLCDSPLEAGSQHELAVAQSLSIVKYIRERYGDQKMIELVSSYAQGGDCESGVSNTLGMTPELLEDAWLDAQQAPSNPEQFIDKFGLWILILVAGFGLASMVVRIST